MVCFKYIIVNTLHKGANKDDDDDDDNNNNNNNNNSMSHLLTSWFNSTGPIIELAKNIKN
jgi:hypothetical protein